MNPLPTQRLPIYSLISFACMFIFISLLHLIAGSLQIPNIASALSAATVGGCPLFPADNIWNRDISSLPVHRNSANFIASIGLTSHVHADFGAGLYNGAPIGIPPILLYLVVSLLYLSASTMLTKATQIILTALKRYGMIVADNGSSWYISGAPDNRWNNDDLHILGTIPGSDFEAVDESSLQVNINSGQASGSMPFVSTPSPTRSSIAPTTRITAPSTIMTPEIAVSINRSIESKSKRNNVPASSGSKAILPIAFGSIAALLTIIIVRSRVLWVRGSRK